MAIQEDRRRITVRLTVLQVACVAVFAVLGISFWFLQIVENALRLDVDLPFHPKIFRAPASILPHYRRAVRVVHIRPRSELARKGHQLVQRK